jgi:copper homeostasis protein
MHDVLVEACVESAESAVAAENGGAQRVELCANLVEGGTTPSDGTMIMARSRLSIPIHVMIRPRGGDFYYTELEREIMFRDIEAAQRCGMNGVVLGVLTTEGDVDVPFLHRLVEASRPLGVTFHRAFDVCRDPEQALETLIELGVERILTSGQQADVASGMAMIAKINELAAGRIVIMPGGGIGPSNARTVVDESGAGEIHVHVARDFPSPMSFRNEAVFMGGEYQPNEYRRTETDAAGIRAVGDVLEGA